MRNTHTGLWFVRRYPRVAARLGWQAVKHPRRTATIVAVARQAPIVARRARVAAHDPEVQQHLKIGRDALGKAAMRLRDSDPGDAVTDETLRAELRRAAGAMAGGYQAAAHPRKRRRRLGRTVLAVGMIGAGAYAGYRVVRERQNGSAPVSTTNDYDQERDETLAASFPASDPPPGPAA